MTPGLFELDCHLLNPFHGVNGLVYVSPYQPGINTPVSVVHVEFKSFLFGKREEFLALRFAFGSKKTVSAGVNRTGDSKSKLEFNNH